MGDEEHPDGCAVVLCNGTGEGKKRMEVGSVRFSPFSTLTGVCSHADSQRVSGIKHRAGEKWTDILGWYQGEITIGEDGWAGQFSISFLFSFSFSLSFLSRPLRRRIVLTTCSPPFETQSSPATPTPSRSGSRLGTFSLLSFSFNTLSFPTPPKAEPSSFRLSSYQRKVQGDVLQGVDLDAGSSKSRIVDKHYLSLTEQFFLSLLSFFPPPLLFLFVLLFRFSQCILYHTR